MKKILKLKENDNYCLSLENVTDFLEVMAHYLKTSEKGRHHLKENLFVMIELKESKYPFFLKIAEGLIDYGSGKMESANIIFIMDLSTLSEIIFGRLEVMVAVFSEKIKFIGDLYKMMYFLEIFYSSLDYSRILSKKERIPLIEVKEMKDLLEVFHIGSSIGAPHHLSSFFKLVSLYANHCKAEQENMMGREMVIYLRIKDIKIFQIMISDQKFTWKVEEPREFTLKIESNLRDFIDIIINGDPITSFMAGNLKLEGNNAIPDAIFFQDLIGNLLDFLGLRNY